MSRKKELHLGTQMEDLDKLYVIPDVRTKKIQILLESGKKLFREAERHYREGDEELAYVYYMKYFKLLHSIHKKPDYPQHKQAVRQVLGGNKVNKIIMDKVELLNESLKRRYSALNETKSEHAGSRVHKTSKKDESLLNATFQNSSSFNGEKIYAFTNSLNTITCKELLELIQKNNVLILDCRPSEDYKISHLTYEWAVNIRQEYIQKGMSAGKLQDKLDNETKIIWSARSVKDQVVIIDWNSTSENRTEENYSSILLNILQNWDPDVTYRSSIKILEGGYEFFIMMYPTLCTNPVVQAPQAPKAHENIIDDIEYPSIYDITMKSEIRERDFHLNALSQVEKGFQLQTTTNRPTVDRSSKTEAIKIYEQKAISEIVKEHEELLQKAQVNDEELKETTKKLETLYEEQAEEGKKQNIREEKELLFNLMQLNSAAEDEKTKTNILLEQLDICKKKAIEHKGQSAISEEANKEDLIRKVEMKLQERQKLNQARELEREQREKQLAAARETKQTMKNVLTVKDELKIPEFDRSTKPQLDLVSRYVDRYRDFSPVYGNIGLGLTGLKNLGNTCYMNSILQCLSNTSQLTEYCVTDKYKSYISRSNKTQGHIIEEFAALIKVLWSGKYKCVASKDLQEVIGMYHKLFSGIDQQDSHEFLTILMDWLHSDLQTLRVQEKQREFLSASERAWLNFTKSKESLILHLFYGQIKSTVKCVECNKESATYDSFSNLSLELPTTNSVCNLYQCLDMYFSGELIHGWNCPTCKEKREVVKKLDLSKWPPVLIIHLKRFYAENDGGNSYKKKQNYVQFPLTDLDITPYIAKSELRSLTPKAYQLYSVSNHYGSMESGHYTAFCKSGNYNRWFKFDDQVVAPLDSSNVVSSAAYILFYTWLPFIQINSSR